jgi:hypothetical protein
LVAAKTVLPDSIWTIRQQGEHHHVEANEIWLSADRPGAGTGSEVLDKGYIQWETGFECLHTLGAHMLTMPTSLFRFGVHKRVELRMEYTGVLMAVDHPDGDPRTADEHLYAPSPLCLGTKILLCDHYGGALEQKWIPRTALLCNLGLPISKSLATDLPVSGSINLLFENEVTNWFSVGYDVGAHWLEWKPEPDVFASLSLNFQPTEQWGCFIENFNYFGFLPSAAQNTVYNVFLDFGITYSPHPRVQLDVNAGFNCYDSDPLLSGPKNFAFAGLGIAWKLR